MSLSNSFIIPSCCQQLSVTLYNRQIHITNTRGNELNKQNAFVQILRKLLCVDRYFHVSVFCVFVWKRNKCLNQNWFLKRSNFFVINPLYFSEFLMSLLLIPVKTLSLETPFWFLMAKTEQHLYSKCAQENWTPFTFEILSCLLRRFQPLCTCIDAYPGLSTWMCSFYLFVFLFFLQINYEQLTCSVFTFVLYIKI